MNEYWSYWSCESSINGRQRWLFTPPTRYKSFTEGDWESPAGKSFLQEMSSAFMFDKTDNPNSADKVYRSQQRISHQATQSFGTDKIFGSAYKATQYYQTLQADSGHWPGDYGGPLFLTPGLIIASYVTETPLPAPYRCMLIQYCLNHQNKDGGWGLHIEGVSTMFGTVMQYVALRLLGLEAQNEAALKARNWIISNGGATGVPSWGKFYLAVLGVYDWQGVNSLCPEMWLLPQGLPVHPSRYWCHARMVYLPMAYCFANRITATETKLIKELRQELYVGKYESINWRKARNHCAATDLYNPQSILLKFLNSILNVYEKVHSPVLRKKANLFMLDYLNAEDKQTNYIDIGPVNQAINSICIWHAYGVNSVPFKKHVERWFDYLWLAEDGMKMNGYNGSQLWDTAFATQAIIEGGFEEHFPETITRAGTFIAGAQVKEEVPEHKKFFRHDSVGGWPFSTAEHGWPITDCTAEGLKTALLIEEFGIRNSEGAKPAPNVEFSSAFRIPHSALTHAVDLILSFQNKNGGWASYELTRGPKWLELLNPSEIFGNIMIDYSYAECTSACVQSLLKFRARDKNYCAGKIELAVKRGVEFILSQQRKDGSWYGSWAVCFTYGTWFAVEGLAAALYSGLVNDKKKIIQQALEKAAQFLVSKQNADGGWGESFESCIRKEYVPHQSSQIVNTSWALLSLMASGYGDKSVVKRGVDFLLTRQMENGDFPQEGISGVFNHSCGISYTSYRNVFPIWVLGRYLKKYRSKEVTNELSLEAGAHAFSQ